VQRELVAVVHRREGLVLDRRQQRRTLGVALVADLGGTPQRTDDLLDARVGRLQGLEAVQAGLDGSAPGLVAGEGLVDVGAEPPDGSGLQAGPARLHHRSAVAQPQARDDDSEDAGDVHLLRHEVGGERGAQAEGVVDEGIGDGGPRPGDRNRDDHAGHQPPGRDQQELADGDRQGEPAPTAAATATCSTVDPSPRSRSTSARRPRGSRQRRRSRATRLPAR
jgi:hypothetical protein